MRVLLRPDNLLPINSKNQKNADFQQSSDFNNQRSRIAKIACGVLSGFALIGIAYYAFKSWNPSVLPINEELLDYTAIKNAEKCIPIHDQQCQQNIKQTFTKLVEKNSTLLQNLVDSCFKQENSGCQEIVQEAFPILMEKNPMKAAQLAHSCIGVQNQGCQAIVNRAFPDLFKLNAQMGFDFAKACIGQQDLASQKVVEEAYAAFLQKGFKWAEGFAKACEGHIELACQKILSPEGTKLLADYQPPHITLYCDERNAEECMNKAHGLTKEAFVKGNDLIVSYYNLKGNDEQISSA